MYKRGCVKIGTPSFFDCAAIVGHGVPCSHEHAAFQ